MVYAEKPESSTVIFFSGIMHHGRSSEYGVNSAFTPSQIFVFGFRVLSIYHARGVFRSIGVNRTDFLSLIQMRPGMEKDCNILEWVAFASNAFNVLVPFYAWSHLDQRQEICTVHTDRTECSALFFFSIGSIWIIRGRYCIHCSSIHP